MSIERGERDIDGTAMASYRTQTLRIVRSRRSPTGHHNPPSPHPTRV